MPPGWRICVLAVACLLIAGAGFAQENNGPQIKIGGYVKLDFIQDFDPVGNPYQWKTNTIPVDGSAAADQEGQTTLHARETRLTLTLLEDTPRGSFKAYIEGDFFGDNNTFRIRHAYGQIGEILGGQTWTTFMDISARPRSLDYEGPDAEIFVRQPLARWTRPLSDGWQFALAVEQPGSQFVRPDTLTGSARNNMPDIPASLRVEGDRGHVQLAGIVRQIRFDGESGSANVSTTGYGANLSFRLNAAGKDALMGEVAFGRGIARYIESFNGENVDAVFTSVDEMEALQASSGVLAYERHWHDSLQSSVAFAMAILEDDDRLAPSAVKQTQDGRVNLIWSPLAKVDVGAEVLWGTRENQDGADGDAWRFQSSLIYKLN